MRTSAARLVVATLLLFLGTCGGKGGGATGSDPAVRPNFVYVLIDDMDDGYGAWIDNFPKLKTLLAEQGVSFSRSFVSVSLCCPSRVTILRGQYAHNTQIFTNGGRGGGFQKAHDLGLEQSTLATWLHDAGYRTALMGKYLNGYPGRLPREYVPPGWDEWDSGEKNAYRQIDYELNENGRIVTYGHDPKDFMQDVLTSKAEDFIHKSVESKSPFFLFMCAYAPHQPAAFAPRHADAFPDAKAPRVPSFDAPELALHPEWVHHQSPLSPSDVATIDELYRKRLRAMLGVQDSVARLIEILAETGQTEKTYFFFHSDNGFHLGQHRLRPGKNTEFEEDLHVPLIVRGPGIARGIVRDQLTLNTDLAPTILELAHVPTPGFVDGRSLVPLLGKDLPQRLAWRQAVLLEHGFLPTKDDGRTPPKVPPTMEPPDVMELSDFEAPPPYTGLRTADKVYTAYPLGDERELYDLTKDAYEMTNLAATDPETVAKMDAWMKSLATCAGTDCRAAEDSPPTPAP